MQRPRNDEDVNGQPYKKRKTIQSLLNEPVTPMHFRFLGNTGLKVSVIGLGGWITFGSQVKYETTLECIRTAVHHGINFFDTAETYAGGQSEIDMGRAIRHLKLPRKDIVVSTKIFWGGKGPNDRGLSRKHVIEGLAASLKRLQLDYVDVVFAHRPDLDTPMEEIVRAFNWCISKGWALYWGTSEWSSQQITEAHLIAAKLGISGPIQPQYNVFHRERVEKEYLSLYSTFHMGVTAWSPLATGILTGKYNHGIPEDARLSMRDHPVVNRIRCSLKGEEGLKKLDKVRRLQEIADELNCTTAQLAIAWCIKNEHVSSVIIGASRPSQIEQNIKALDVTAKLTPNIVQQIEVILENKPEKWFNFRYS
ncbi:hypothetical protein BZG36_00359 [Bifiguratus adelaidae]|uniref:NADP-dependent oxidoreductase domain-containing protein n=1 Tax=Bifiguratus adelaidae TaxID=1938954 RepID=A0A261Y7P2_9FUNG|nr:hypothetical protein BZG36_00359 [Bifiguratus adelaidae]